MPDTLVFVVFPYLAFAVGVVGAIARLIINPFSYTARSSQLLESRVLFWGSICFHFAILGTISTHFLGIFMPWAMRAVIPIEALHKNLEIGGAAVSMAILLGLVIFISRRAFIAEARITSTVMDWIVLACLLLEAFLGFYMAVLLRDGPIYFIDHATPWLHSLARFQPDTSHIAGLPFVARLHFLVAFLILLLIPFSRLTHFLTLPVGHLFRRYGRHVWNRRPSAR